MDTGVSNATSADIRSWIAKGRKGEVYLAFFNLSEQKTPIYAHRSDLSKAFTGKRIRSCKGQELWSGNYVATKKGSISMEVGVHGCALFVLNCK